LPGWGVEAAPAGWQVGCVGRAVAVWSAELGPIGGVAKAAVGDDDEDRLKNETHHVSKRTA
jgi:hypothetical protein